MTFEEKLPELKGLKCKCGRVAGITPMFDYKDGNLVCYTCYYEGKEE